MQGYTDVNAKVFDRWNKEGWEWGVPIDHAAFVRAKEGEWSVLLTPTRPVPAHWFGELQGKRVLGLASGGGQQMPVFAAAGAVCTVLDYSLSQLESERMVAVREGYEIGIVRADMTKPLPFADEQFDLIFHPVSNCYIEQVEPLWKECARVLKKGGALLAGFDNGVNYAYGDDESKLCYKLPFNPLKDEKLYEDSIKNDWGVQFSHTIEEQIGGQLRAGFRLADIYQDTNGAGLLHEHGVPCYYATLAIKE
ncbi:MAG: class I SAM-dependent methyltransferase [Clostridia bacterium]|nr:class I SAM-dependent methyltransferase [Clostridia bacterium]